MSEASDIIDLTTKLKSADPNAVAEALSLIERLASLFQQKMDLDQMLTAEQAGEWLQCSAKSLNEDAKHNRIPAIPWRNQFRFHPRTILTEGHRRYFKTK